ncbi:MAG: hypothetical protein U9R19_09710 [Bacteroidota bacterium]|nr:hypothetical protein [Bacteroidota bacterium]
MKKQKIYNNISSLLLNRAWTKLESKSKFDIYLPPTDLGISKGYNLHIYNKIENNDFEKSILKSIDILTQIYLNDDIDDLGSIIIDDRQILTFHIHNDDIKNGNPSIPFFGNLIQNSKELLEQIANFTVIQKPHFFEGKEEAERYLNYCNFFKNDIGSLITKIQLPNNEFIKEKTLFEPAGLMGNQINRNLMNVTDFINNEIIAHENFEPDDNFIVENEAYISVNVSDKIKNLYKNVEYADIELSLKGIDVNETTIAKDLSREKVNNLASFSKKIREKMKEITENYIYISGKIIQLQSKDIESDKNTISIESTINNVKNRVSVKLSSEQIKLAAEAFKSNKKIFLNCKIEKEKSKYKVTELNSFDIG